MEEKIKRFLHISDGSGDGSGSGFGSGDGSGSDYGDGDGSGSGFGSGDGSGSDYGDGDGDGDGDGSGYGDGDGYGDGFGSGDGDGFGSGDGDGSGYGDGDGSGSDYGYGSGSDYGYGSGFGSGDGSGSDYGDGDGYGSGFGSGDGSGYGSGDGYGYGDGDGYGYGSGDGDGFGSGDGDGDGSGYGDGDGSGVEAINSQKIYMIDDIPTIIKSIHGNYVKGFILNSDLTLSPCYIAKVGNYFAHGETLKQAVKDATAKYEQNLPIAERINRFISQYPSLNISVKASELFDWHNKLTGSCLFGRQEFCKSHDIDYTNGYYTVSEFINITINAYGSNVIKQLKDTYEKKNKDTPHPN